MIYNKEDKALAIDIEAMEPILSLSGTELEETLDNPLDRLKFLFPNKRHPEKSLKDIILRIVCMSIDIPKNSTLAEIVAIWCTKTKKSKLELDIIVNSVIDAEFRVLVELEAELDYLDIVKNKQLELERFDIVNKNSNFLTENYQIRNNLYVQPDYDDDGNYIFDNSKYDLDFTGFDD